MIQCKKLKPCDQKKHEMDLSVISVDWLDVLLATFVYIFFCGFWQRPFVFGKKWTTAMGFERPDGWKETPIYYTIPVTGFFFVCLTLATINSIIRIDHIEEAGFLGLAVGVGFLCPVTMVNAVVPVFGRPLEVGLITASAHLVADVLASLVIYVG